MLKKARGFELTELFAIVAIIGILAALLMPTIVTAIQKSKQKITLKDTNVISTAINEKIKAGKRTFDKYIQGIMGVNRAEKKLAKSTEKLNEHLAKTWRINPWEKARLSKDEQEKAKKEHNRKSREDSIDYRGEIKK